jgi:hypothetical protein
MQFLKTYKKNNYVSFSRIRFPRKNTSVMCTCMIAHCSFILHLLNDNGKFIININNTHILWLKKDLIDLLLIHPHFQ